MKFCLHSFERFCLQSKDAKCFLLTCPRHCDRGTIVFSSILFTNLKQKQNNIYISIVNNGHMGPMFIETHQYIENIFGFVLLILQMFSALFID